MKRTQKLVGMNGRRMARLSVFAAVGAATLLCAGSALAQARRERGWGTPPTIPPPTTEGSNIIETLTAVGLGVAMVGVQFIGSKRTHRD